MSGPPITVVVPTHNRAPVLVGALAAILNQEGVDVRVVVVDEGSSDATPAVLSALAERDERVDVVRHPEPRGLPAARNAGVAATDTRWVAFCDDDDLWAPGKLAAQLETVDATGARWSCTGSVLVDARLRVIGHQRLVVDGREELLQRLRPMNVIPSGGSTVMVDAELLREVGGFDETLPSSEDWDCWLRLAQREGVACVDRPLAAARVWSGSMSTQVDRMRATSIQVRDRYGGQRTRGNDDQVDYDRFLARQLVRAGARRRASLAYLRLALDHRQPAQVARALLTLPAPDLLDRLGNRQGRRKVPPSWLAEAEAWLARLAVLEDQAPGLSRRPA
jgi:glycosyltransferase involved in cell wall biosynthesis